MKLELMIGNSEEEAARLLAVSRQQREGLTLTAEQARTVALAHGDALRRTGRIEWGPSAAEGLLNAFAGSPWLTRENQGQQLADLLGPVLRLPGRAAGQSARRLAAGANAASL